MSARHCHRLSLAACLILAWVASADPKAHAADGPLSAIASGPIRIDQHGDPLPPGAAARLGTVRFRHAYGVPCVACSPGGKWLAAADGEVIRLWDVATAKEVRQFRGYEGNVACLAYSPDGKTIASGGSDNIIHLWDEATGKEVRRFKRHRGESPTDGGVVQVLFSPDGKVLVSCGGDKTIRLWDAATGKELRQFTGAKDRTWTIALATDGQALAAFAKKNEKEPGEVWLWEVPSTRPARHWLLPDDVFLVVFSPDLKKLASTPRSAGAFEGIKVWDTATGAPTPFIGGLPSLPTSLAFSPDGKVLVGSNVGKQIRLWDFSTARELRHFPDPHPDHFSRVGFCPGGKALVAWGMSRNTIHLYDAITGQDLRTFGGHEQDVRAVTFSPNGKLLASAEAEEIRLWDVAAGRQVGRLRGDLNFVTGLTFLPDNKTLLSTSANRGLHLWDAAAGRELRAQQTGANLCGLAFCPDGKAFATWDIGGHALTVRDATSWKALREWQSPQEWIWCCTFAPDSDTLVFNSANHSIRRWDVVTGRVLPEIGKYARAVSAVAVSPDGRILAGVDWYEKIHLWETATGQLRGVVDTGGNVSRIAFSPDGRLLAAANYRVQNLNSQNDKTTGDESCQQVRVVDVATAKVIHRFGDHRGGVVDIVFSPDGRLLASGSQDTTILLWDVASLLRARRAPPARLKAEELETLWADLAGADGVKAHRAIWTLAAAPEQSLPFLTAHGRPFAPADPGRMGRLLADLDSDRFAVRDKASRELERLAEAAEPALRKALAGPCSLETRRRLELLLAKLDGPVRLPDLRRTLRAIEVLEHIGTAGARRVLEQLARGVPGSRPTREARASLRRLERRPATPAGPG